MTNTYIHNIVGIQEGAEWELTIFPDGDRADQLRILEGLVRDSVDLDS